MALTFQWPFKITESRYQREISALHSQIAELRSSGGVNIPGQLFNNLWPDTTNKIHVTEETALGLAAVYQAIRISCDSLNIPIEVFKRMKDGGRVPVTKADPYENQCRFLLHTSPNLMMTPTTWVELMEWSRLIYGNGYSYIVRNKLQEPLALRWYHPNQVEIKVRNGIELRYWFKDESGNYEYSDIYALDVIHVKNLSFNGVTGRGIIDVAKDSLMGGLAGQKTGNKFYQDGMTSKVVLSHPGNLGTSGEAKKNLQNSFEEEMRKRSTIVLEEGTKVYNLTIPPEQAQFLQSREFSVTEVSRWFNIPEHMLSNNQHSTFSNIENQFLEFLIMNVRGRTRLYEQEFNWKLLGNDPDFFTEFNMDALLRADTQSQAQYFMTAIQNGWMTRNEVRTLKNLNNLPDGDEALTPMNLTTDKEREESKTSNKTIEPTNGGGKPAEEMVKKAEN